MMPPTRRVASLLATVALLGSAAACVPFRSAPVTVTVLAPWTEDPGEARVFMNVAGAYAKSHDFTLRYKGNRSVDSILQVEAAGSSSPDIAVLPSPASLASYASLDKLVMLDSAAGADPRQLLYRANKPDRPYGVVLKTSLKSMVWYDAGIRTATPPANWAQLVARSAAARDSGLGTPWCLGLASGTESGWPGTDWVEDILLHQSGVEAYRKWATGALPWTSVEVRSAWLAWGELLAASGMARAEAAKAMVVTGWNNVDRSACAMEHQASFVLDKWTGAPRTAGFFLLPAFNGGAQPAVEVSVDVAGLFSAKPQAKALLMYLASGAGQREWIKQAKGTFYSQRTDIDRRSAYGANPVAYQIAEQLATTRNLCLDASNFMPKALGDAFSQAVLEFLAPSDPGATDAEDRLSSILQELDRVQSTVVASERLADPCPASG